MLLKGCCGSKERIYENLIVISGGPGSGKTTLLRELNRLGFCCEPEAARQIIQEQVQAGGTALPWGNRANYTELMLRRSVASYVRNESAAAPVFFDRGIPDTLAYARLIGLEDASWIERECRRYQYARQVFVAPPWEEIYAKDAERKQDFEEAERTFAQVVSVYRELGYDVLELPKATVAVRAEYVVGRASGRPERRPYFR